MSIIKHVTICGAVALAFGAGVWWAGSSKTSSPPSNATIAPAPVAEPAARGTPLPPAQKQANPRPQLPASQDPLADAFGRQVPALAAVDAPVPAELKGHKGLLGRQQLEKARTLMNQMGPETLRFLRDELRLSDRDIQAVADAQKEMDASVAAIAEQARGRDPASMNEVMKTAFQAYSQKLDSAMGHENTARFHEFRSGQFRKIAEQSGMPAPPSL